MNGLKDKGFSLLEVMVALVIFAIFIGSYVATEGYNKKSSSEIRNETILQYLAEYKLNEITINPPKFSLALTQSPEEGRFEIEDYEDYTWKAEYRELEVPDLSAIQGKEEEDEEQAPVNPVVKRVFREIRTYVKKKIWQVTVTVEKKPENKDAEGIPHSLSAWLSNEEAKPKLRL